MRSHNDKPAMPKLTSELLSELLKKADLKPTQEINEKLNIACVGLCLHGGIIKTSWSGSHVNEETRTALDRSLELAIGYLDLLKETKANNDQIMKQQELIMEHANSIKEGPLTEMAGYLAIVGKLAEEKILLGIQSKLTELYNESTSITHDDPKQERRLKNALKLVYETANTDYDELKTNPQYIVLPNELKKNSQYNLLALEALNKSLDVTLAYIKNPTDTNAINGLHDHITTKKTSLSKKLAGALMILAGVAVMGALGIAALPLGLISLGAGRSIFVDKKLAKALAELSSIKDIKISNKIQTASSLPPTTKVEKEAQLKGVPAIDLNETPTAPSLPTSEEIKEAEKEARKVQPASTIDEPPPKVTLEIIINELKNTAANLAKTLDTEEKQKLNERRASVHGDDSDDPTNEPYDDPDFGPEGNTVYSPPKPAESPKQTTVQIPKKEEPAPKPETTTQAVSNNDNKITEPPLSFAEKRRLAEKTLSSQNTHVNILKKTTLSTPTTPKTVISHTVSNTKEVEIKSPALTTPVVTKPKENTAPEPTLSFAERKKLVAGTLGQNIGGNTHNAIKAKLPVRKTILESEVPPIVITPQQEVKRDIIDIDIEMKLDENGIPIAPAFPTDAEMKFDENGIPIAPPPPPPPSVASNAVKKNWRVTVSTEHKQEAQPSVENSKDKKSHLPKDAQNDQLANALKDALSKAGRGLRPTPGKK